MTGVSPYFELWDNKSTGSIGLSNYTLTCEEKGNPASRKSINALGAVPMIIKPSTVYKIVWQINGTPQVHECEVTSQRAFGNEVTNISRFDKTTARKTDATANIAAFYGNVYPKFVGGDSIFAFNWNALVGYNKLVQDEAQLQLWPPQSFQAFSSSYLCPRIIHYDFRKIQSDVRLGLISVNDEKMLLALSNLRDNQSEPFYVGEKIQPTYENDKMFAYIAAFSVDTKLFYSYIPKQIVQKLRVKDKSGNFINATNYKTRGIVLNTSAYDGANYNCTEIPVGNGIVSFFNTDDFADAFGNGDNDPCTIDPKQPFTFDILLYMDNIQTNQVEIYRFYNLSYTGQDKTHEVQLY